jgi:hypothetical protein
VVWREEGSAAVVHAEGEPREEDERDEDPAERPHRRRRRGMLGLVRVGGEVGSGTPDLAGVGLCGLLREEGAKGTGGGFSKRFVLFFFLPAAVGIGSQSDGFASTRKVAAAAAAYALVVREWAGIYTACWGNSLFVWLVADGWC